MGTHPKWAAVCVAAYLQKLIAFLLASAILSPESLWGKIFSQKLGTSGKCFTCLWFRTSGIIIMVFPLLKIKWPIASRGPVVGTMYDKWWDTFLWCLLSRQVLARLLNIWYVFETVIFFPRRNKMNAFWHQRLETNCLVQTFSTSGIAEQRR